MGFKPEEIGIKLIRYRAVMTMYMEKVPVYTIMFIGHWLSDTFINYIRKQVEKFNPDVSAYLI